MLKAKENKANLKGEIKENPLTGKTNNLPKTDVESVKTHYDDDFEAYVDRLWESNTELHEILKSGESIEETRDLLYNYLDKAERRMFDIDYEEHILEKSSTRDSIRVFKSIIGPINEHSIKFSSLEYLWKLANDKFDKASDMISIGFLLEFINLFKGVAGKSMIYLGAYESKYDVKEFLKLKGKNASRARTEALDDIGDMLKKYIKRYPGGLDKDIIRWRNDNRTRILKYFKGKEKDWDNPNWHIKHVIKDAKPLMDLIQLNDDEKEAVEKLSGNNIPFGITPYYLSLMDKHQEIGHDHAIRAQVIPPSDYVSQMLENNDNRGNSLDFMGEHDTSPEKLLTRRYPGIAILKPFNTCAQICVYCQRNWEIDQVLDPKALASNSIIDKALSWFDDHTSVGEVLITGGDPLIMDDSVLDYILHSLSKKEHIYRIRIGTRTPVVLPMRWTEKLVKMIAKYNVPGKRQVAIVTHFQHSYEITPEAAEAVRKIRKGGMSVYNQQVFNIENSRRFETVKLRLDLKSIGIDPYYTFNMKGKKETRKYMVPISRILQERKEEARLLPGMDRTDEPVFNVPKLGKNHLRAFQDHKLIMILANGARVYEFHPWEKHIKPVPSYNYTDIPIYEYLEELAARGEKIKDYKSIWFYY